ncbi:hypothetical protein HGG75_20045 [Ochrobactrum pseudogrignonense]|nr:hypothetical protein [Brucella pseudogrignonensis]
MPYAIAKLQFDAAGSRVLLTSTRSGDDRDYPMFSSAPSAAGWKPYMG